MAHVHVLYVLANIRTFDIEVLKVVERRHRDIAVKLHHQRDQTFIADIVGRQTRLGFLQLEHLIVRIACNVVDDHIRMRKKPLDSTLEVLVKAAALE